MRRLLALVPALVAFMATLGGHYWLAEVRAPDDRPECMLSGGACAVPCEEDIADRGYWADGRAFMGLSYGLAAGFFAYVLAHSISRRGGMQRFLAGATFTGVLWLGLCWLVGCCGSPLLPVYVSLFGARFSVVSSPVAFGLTAASAAVGIVWLRRTCGCKECPPGRDGT